MGYVIFLVYLVGGGAALYFWLGWQSLIPVFGELEAWNYSGFIPFLSIAAWHGGIIVSWLVWGFLGERRQTESVEGDSAGDDEDVGFWRAVISVPNSTGRWIAWATLSILFAPGLDLAILLLWTDLISNAIPLGLVQWVDNAMSVHGSNIADWFAGLEPGGGRRRRGGFVFVIAILCLVGHLGAWVSFLVVPFRWILRRQTAN